MADEAKKAAEAAARAFGIAAKKLLEEERMLAEEKDRKLAEEKEKKEKKLAEEKEKKERTLAEEKEEKEEKERKLAEEKEAKERKLAEEKEKIERKLKEEKQKEAEAAAKRAHVADNAAKSAAAIAEAPDTPVEDADKAAELAATKAAEAAAALADAEKAAGGDPSLHGHEKHGEFSDDGGSSDGEANLSVGDEGHHGAHGKHHGGAGVSPGGGLGVEAKGPHDRGKHGKDRKGLWLDSDVATGESGEHGRPRGDGSGADLSPVARAREAAVAADEAAKRAADAAAAKRQKAADDAAAREKAAIEAEVRLGTKYDSTMTDERLPSVHRWSSSRRRHKHRAPEQDNATLTKLVVLQPPAH